METNVTINLKNLENNAKAICKKYNDYKYKIAVVKSNAYGHGYKVVNSFIKGGINYIAVSYLYEALEVRKYNKDIPILCMQPIDVKKRDIAIRNDITITVHTLDYLKELIKDLDRKIKVHIKIDSGMNRLGFKDAKSFNEAYKLIEKNKFIYLEGLYTHFATTGIFDKNWDNQVERFVDITVDIDLEKIDIVHLYSSTSLLDHKKLSFANAFRVGIAIYGYNVSPHYSNKGLKNKLRNLRNYLLRTRYNISAVNYDVDIDLKRAMTMSTYIIQIKEIKKGEPIGYGGKPCKEDMLVAVLPIGYANGIGHSSNRYVIINDKKYYMVGSMSMNMMMIKVDKSVKLSDEVIVLGKDITLGEMARFKNSQISEVLLEIGNNNFIKYIGG